MNFTIRQEEKRDYPAVHTLIEQAFKDIPESDHREQFLVERLRQSPAFIPELSLVAELGTEIIGQVILSKVEIVADHSTPSLGMAPLSVLPNHQKSGIGTALIREAHQRAIRLGYHSVVLLGHPDYYTRFGYRKASTYGICFPFDAPDECCMVAELIPNGLNNVHGTVQYAQVFYE